MKQQTFVQTAANVTSCISNQNTIELRKRIDLTLITVHFALSTSKGGSKCDQNNVAGFKFLRVVARCGITGLQCYQKIKTHHKSSVFAQQVSVCVACLMVENRQLFLLSN